MKEYTNICLNYALSLRAKTLVRILIARDSDKAKAPVLQWHMLTCARLWIAGNN